jgi:hypothetical protein
VGVFDWFGRRRGESASTLVWHVYCERGDVVAEDGRGATYRVPLAGARAVRVVPLTGGNHHPGARGGWQVALARADGDVLVGVAQDDWRPARELAQLLCDKTELPFDELTEKMFSRVGQFTTPPPQPRSREI